MGIKQLARYSNAIALGFMLLCGARVEAQNQAPSITVYQDPT